MIRLASPTRLQALLAIAPTTTQPDIVTSYRDSVNESYAQFRTFAKAMVMTGTVAINIVDSPTPAAIREIDFIAVRNNDTASASVTIRAEDSGATYKIITVTLATGEHLYFTTYLGWYVTRANGSVKESISSAGIPWETPGTIGSTTPNTGAFTTLSATGAITGASASVTGQLTSTVATGTAPLAVTSTTKVGNLNADLLDDKDWVAPGTIGSTTPNTGKFTTLEATGTLTPDALVDISGASAGQIKFPASQNDSANANTLDDYEEGTWTPADGSGAGLSLTAGGSYTKVGRLVTVQATVSYPVTASGANVVISGLPFTVNATWNGVAAGYTNCTIATTVVAAAGNTAMILANAATAANITNAQMSGKFVAFSMIYEV